MQQQFNFYRMKVLFWHRKNKENKKKEAPIYCRISINGSRIDFSTNVFCTIGNFNAKKQEIENNQVLNLILSELKNSVHSIYLQLMVKKQIVTPQAIKQGLFSEDKIYTLKDLLNIFDQHRFELFQTNKIKKRTYQHSIGYTRAIIKYFTFIKALNLELKQITPKMVTQFYDWLIFTQHINLTHACRTAKFLISAYDYAVNNELIDFNHLHRLKFKKSPQKKIEFLTEDELHQLQLHRFGDDRLENVKNLFLLQCYTGLSYADLEVFTPQQHIETDHKGRSWIIKQREKNGNESVLPLFENAKMILDKNCPKVISNQKYNFYLKEIAEALQLKLNLTTHIGRKTFGTIALNKGFSLESVSKMLGHNSTKTTEAHYAQVLRQRVINESLKNVV